MLNSGRNAFHDFSAILLGINGLNTISLVILNEKQYQFVVDIPFCALAISRTFVWSENQNLDVNFPHFQVFSMFTIWHEFPIACITGKGAFPLFLQKLTIMPLNVYFNSRKFLKRKFNNLNLCKLEQRESCECATVVLDYLL